MSRQLRSGNSHVTSLKTVKRSYKKPIKAATILQATEAVTVLVDKELNVPEPVASENEEENETSGTQMGSLRLDESNQSTTSSFVLASPSAIAIASTAACDFERRHIRRRLDDSLNNEPAAKSKLF